MSHSFDAHDAIEEQKAIGRLRRRQAGADTTRDDAEVRHDAIHTYVSCALFFGPMLFAAAVGWISFNPVLSWCISVYGGVVIFAVAAFLSAMAHGLVGVFRPNAGRKTLHAVIQAGGVGMLILALGSLSFGAGLAAIGFIATPSLWQRWARRVMANTDFARLSRMPITPAAPAIVE